MIMKYSLRTIMLGFTLLSGMISSTTAECVDVNGFILKNDTPRNCVDYVARCNNNIVAENCPVTCGTCPTTTEAPVAANTGAPTEAPVAVTTGAPVAVTTEAPVAATTGAPVAVTTEAPVAATTGAPVAVTTGAPVAVTTGAPVAVTTGAPVAVTTEAPVAATTGAPVAATTGAPTGAPIAATTGAPVAVTTPKNGWSSPPILRVDSLTYNAGDDISVTFNYGPGNELDWVGIFEAGTATEDWNITTVKDWLYVDNSARSGTIVFNSTGLDNGEYKAYLFGNNTYTPVAESSVFTLSEETGGVPRGISSSSVIAPSALVMSMMVGVVATLFA